MNYNKIDFNNGNLRIAPNSFSPTSPSLVIPNTNTDLNDSDNDTNNNNNNNNSLHSQHSFATSFSSPSLDDSSNTISIASLNVKGFASSVPKFDAVMDDLFNKNISIIGLQETHIPERSAAILFKQRCAIGSNTFPYRAYWDYNPIDRFSGVAIIIKDFISKYVQKITKYQ